MIDIIVITLLVVCIVIFIWWTVKVFTRNSPQPTPDTEAQRYVNEVTDPQRRILRAGHVAYHRDIGRFRRGGRVEVERVGGCGVEYEVEIVQRWLVEEGERSDVYIK